MRLRLRHKDGQGMVTSLTPQSTLLHLQHAISSTLDIPGSRLELRSGYPPRVLTISGTLAQQSLESQGIRDGDMILVSEGDFAAVDSSASVSDATPQSSGNVVQTVQAPTVGEGSTKEQRPSDPTPVVSNANNNSTGGGSADGIRVRDLGYLVVREVQDDNSCLFNAIAFTVDQSMKTNIQGLRKIIAQAIEADPETYTDAMLGRPRKEYCDWIQRENSWGGAIELAIFSEHYKIEIDSIEVLSTRVDRFGEGKFSQRAILMYSGIHYDAVALTPGYELPADCDQTQFDSSEEYIIKTGIQLAERLRKAHKFTDLATFTLRCSTCQTGLRGQKDAHQHAMETMHVAFEEYV